MKTKNKCCLEEKKHSPFLSDARGGVVTFISMAYILAVNPIILSATGMPKEDIFFATCASSAVATLLMGLWAKYPFALAPGMGLNAFFAYTVCIENNIPWQTALGAVLLSGILFVVLSVLGFRKKLLEIVPKDLGHAIAAGIGLFIAFIGLQHAGLVTKHDATLVSLGKLSNPQTLIAIVGLISTVVFVCLKIRGAILIGILLSSALAFGLNEAAFPSSVFSAPQLPKETFGAAFWSFTDVFKLQFLPIVFVMLFVDMFDTMGTLLALGHTANQMDDKGKLPRANRAFLADAIGTITGAITGTSTVTTYIESATGIMDGAKTGKANIVVAVLFLGALFLGPMFIAIPAFATASALIVVGTLMFSQVAHINWNKAPIAISATLTILSMPTTFSISTGIGIGLISYVIAHVAAKEKEQVSVPLVIIAILFITYFIAETIW